MTLDVLAQALTMHAGRLGHSGCAMLVRGGESGVSDCDAPTQMLALGGCLENWHHFSRRLLGEPRGSRE